MANTSSLGGGPISFVDGDGIQYAIPLPWVSFPPPPAVAPDASFWPGWLGAAGSQKTSIGTWITGLGTQGLLSTGAAPPNPPAFSIAALAPGAGGNDITMAFTAVHADGTMDVTVTVQQVYPGLTYTSIATVLGTTAANGTEPGLAYLSAVLTGLPAAGVLPFTAAAAGDPFECAVAPGGVLSPSNDPTNVDAGLITAAISAVDTVVIPNSFTLTMAWSKSATNVALSALGTAFGYVLKVNAPASGFGPLPAAGSSVTLLGGTDPSATPATNAGATVISS